MMVPIPSSATIVATTVVGKTGGNESCDEKTADGTY